MDNIRVDKIMKMLIYLGLIMGALLPTFFFIPLGLILIFILVFKQGREIVAYLKRDKFLVILFLIMLLSSILSELWYISIFYTIAFFLKGILSVSTGMFIHEKDYRTVIILLLVIGILVSCIGIGQGFFSTISMPESWVDKTVYDIKYRVYSTFSNPNILAAFLNLIIITGVTAILYYKDRLVKILSYGALVVGMVSITLTYSRGGWISLSLSLIIASLFERRYLKYALMVIISFLSFDYFSEIGRLSGYNLLADSSITYRFEIWVAALRIFKENLILGIGSGTAWNYIHSYSDKLGGYVTHAHNLYLQILLDVGIVGFAVFIAFVKALWKDIRDNIFTPAGIINTISLIYYVSLLAFGFVDAVPLLNQISIFIWFLIGINRKSNYNAKISNNMESLNELIL